MNAETPILKAKDAPDLGSFDWADPFRLSQQLTEDERMIQTAPRPMPRKSWPRASSTPLPMKPPTSRSLPKWATWACWA